MLKTIRNNKGFAVGIVLGIYVATVGLFMFASKRHTQQRIEKQATAEGRVEYPMK